MAVGRRGVVFTLMAIVLVAFLLLGSRLLDPPTTPQQADTAAARSRVTLLDSYTETIEQHAAQSLRTAGYFAFQNISRKIETEGAFISDVNGTVSTCVLNGTLRVGGANMTCLSPRHMLNESMQRLVDLAALELGVSTTYSFERVWVTEELPMEVIIWANISYNVTDTFATWQRSAIVSAAIDMSGVEDPVFAYLNATGKTRERRALRLTATPIASFNGATFGAFYANGSYLPYEGRAPSVLQRYVGKTNDTSLCCGVESVMNRSSLTNVENRYANFSLVDHQFASHLRNLLVPYDCSALQVKAIPKPGGTVVLEARRFDSTYNLTGPLPACSWS